MLGLLLWGLNHLFLIAAFFKQDPRYEPLLAARGQDTAQYFAWIKALTTTWSIPNYFAPWHTEAAQHVPLMWLIGQVNRVVQVSEAAIYLAAHILLYAAGGIIYLLFLRVFARSRREAVYCTLVALCILPTRAYLLLPVLARGRPGWRWSAGFDSFAGGASGDGFFQGVSSSLTVTLGTVGVLLALLLIGRYLDSGSPRDLWGAAVWNGLLTLFHPFEFVTLLPASALTLLWVSASGKKPIGKAIGECMILGIPSTAAALLYVSGAAVPWLKVATDLNRFEQPFHLDRLLILGLPLLAIVGVTLFTAQAARSWKDRLLTLYVLIAVAVFFVPFAPWPRLGGLYYVAAIVAVHRWQDLLAGRLTPGLRKLAGAAAYGVLALALIAHVYFRYASFRIGLEANETPDVVGAVASVEERAVHAWLARQPHVDRQLVLAPHPYATWFTTIPMHSFGSHFLFSLTYPTQRDQADRFFAGTLGDEKARQLLARYGVHWILLPADSSAAKPYIEAARAALRFQTASLALYEVAGAEMKPFPKLTKTQPGVYEWLEAR